MLEYRRLAAPAGDPNIALVLLHGRGSDMHDLAGLRPHLPDRAELVVAQAPNAAAPWGYGPGWAWYRYLGGTTPEPESFSGSLEAVRSFLEELPVREPGLGGPVVLGGFSQGGTVSLAHALSHPETVAGVANFSGFLADHPAVEAEAAAAAPPVFWVHGEMDPAIPFDFAREGWRQLEAAGADLTAHRYRMGHTLSAEELADFAGWLEEILAR
jgi:phospholipase/carboxylesterase